MKILQIKTKYIFGKDIVKLHLSNELIKSIYKRPILIYGGGSIKKNDLYNEIVESCKKAKVKLFEFCGIEPNPKHLTLNKAIKYIKQNKCDLILAAGGGSVIDACKVIGICSTNNNYPNS
jgi:alcohol dehydrogenase YqhD (iron-dependent ADH family)